MTKRPNPGDAVEVKFIGEDGPIWNSAVVEEVHLDDQSYPHIVANTGTQRKAVLRGDFRIPKQTQRPAVTHQPAPDKQTRG